ncbi:hypothetical protein [Deinococcus radiophilus]|nr:hypothetical protein [Deinococcus radiophilus]UFA50358.1 hypothetical protein LMT64_00060 [Deinococcus radiophilus]
MPPSLLTRRGASGWLGGMGGGPNQLWALVACVLSGVSLLTATVALQQQ